MTQAFSLKREREIAPASGEDLGAALDQFAQTQINNPYVREQVLYLAADAYEQAASVSIGHNRSARYEERAKALRGIAERVAAAAKQDRDDKESNRLLQCFEEGYAGRDISRLSFERREAALVGQFYATNRLEMPKRINKVYQPRPLGRDSDRDYLLVDNSKFVVDYPDGKISNAIVTKID